ncbi:hypothetical protein BO86DRAFT_160011 [Aspergillus japonicus CBS 114.51]|uniref:Uncharacterized protein n=1 Tax=Aspergillus japonicus CBS 114.51 TaxID=1448312 RepID=A0A8T8XCI0_ASPJA|nr:hypothetical protein BO86DRAFT_160011 [Aspergillus japonicus CBS 114.51]RAH85534.1 hypothetical protein BO86DRAFT_160011 [Aspergillus japonicus CBS 114.51]
MIRVFCISCDKVGKEIRKIMFSGLHVTDRSLDLLPESKTALYIRPIRCEQLNTSHGGADHFSHTTSSIKKRSNKLIFKAQCIRTICSSSFLQLGWPAPVPGSTSLGSQISLQVPLHRTHRMDVSRVFSRVGLSGKTNFPLPPSFFTLTFASLQSSSTLGSWVVVGIRRS